MSIFQQTVKTKAITFHYSLVADKVIDTTNYFSHYPVRLDVVTYISLSGLVYNELSNAVFTMRF